LNSPSVQLLKVFFFFFFFFFLVKIEPDETFPKQEEKDPKEKEDTGMQPENNLVAAHFAT
jgi:hypothetical protein